MKTNLFYTQEKVIESFRKSEMNFVFDGESASFVHTFLGYEKENCFLPSEERDAILLAPAVTALHSCDFQELSGDAFWEDCFTIDYPGSLNRSSSQSFHVNDSTAYYEIEGQHSSLFDYPKSFIIVSDNTRSTAVLQDEGYYVISTLDFEILNMDCNNINSSSSEYQDIRFRWCDNRGIDSTDFDTAWENRISTLYDPLYQFIIQNNS